MEDEENTKKIWLDIESYAWNGIDIFKSDYLPNDMLVAIKDQNGTFNRYIGGSYSSFGKNILNGAFDTHEDSHKMKLDQPKDVQSIKDQLKELKNPWIAKCFEILADKLSLYDVNTELVSFNVSPNFPEVGSKAIITLKHLTNNQYASRGLRGKTTKYEVKVKLPFTGLSYFPSQFDQCTDTEITHKTFQSTASMKKQEKRQKEHKDNWVLEAIAGFFGFIADLFDAFTDIT